MSITILLEIGHDASLRTKTTPEGFTHDWEVFVKGCNGADIHYYVDKVVFQLHETFPRPKRVVKEPPYSLRTSGYAGFTLPIEIYLRNNQEPKKIRFNYDLELPPKGPPLHKVQKEKYTFFNPSEEFKNKLLKGGAVAGSGGNTLDISDNHRAVDEKLQMTSKPKLSGTDVAKKHKIKPEEPRNTDFENLFGPPIKKTTRAPDPPPKPKEIPKSSSGTEKIPDKDKGDKSKPKQPPPKEKEKEKPKERYSESSEKKKDEKRRSKDDKSKDRGREKEKSSKKEKDKEKSPVPPPRPRSSSPKRSPKRVPTPPAPAQRHSSSKEQGKEEKKDRDKDRSKDDKKSKKDKREHRDSKHRDRDREKDHKEHKSRESKSTKEKERDVSSVIKPKDPSPVSTHVVAPQQTHKTDRKMKEKDSPKEPPPAKEEEKTERARQDQTEDRQKQHKHKKKDRKEKREEKHSRNEKKIEKQPGLPPSSKEVVKEPPAPVPATRDVDKSNLFGSPKSEPPSTPKELLEPKTENSHSYQRDDESSNDSAKISSREPSPLPKAPSKSPSKSPSPPPVEPVKKPEPEKKEEPSTKRKDKKERRKERVLEKKKKRKSEPDANVDPEQPPEKVHKEVVSNNSDDESKVSSTEDANPVMLPKSEVDMDMLRDLQNKIMSLKNNADLQKVVQLIAETGRYEVSANTFDFDLCVLDMATVRQLQEFISDLS